MLDAKAVGNKINQLRNANSLSQDQMAEKLFVTRQAISRWEVGQSLPSIDSLLEMSKLFHVSFEEILCLDEKPEVDEKDIFQGHSRSFIVSEIREGKIQVDLPSVFSQFLPSERMGILSAVKEGRLRADQNRLLPELSASERDFLLGEKGNEQHGTVQIFGDHRKR
jgi:DNA-binding XRE family transcriptional regulator